MRLLRPYLIGDQPKSNGEWDMYCPLHEDVKRSASLNVKSGLFYCQAGCGGGTITDLIASKKLWVSPGVASQNGSATPRRSRASTSEIINDAKIKGWSAALLSNEDALDYLVTERGIHTKTAVDFEIGYDLDRKCYTIPIRGPKNEIWNLRRYRPHGSPKMMQVAGMRSTELYPIKLLKDAERVIFAEGEWDSLITIQHGYVTITRTAAANSNWQSRWTSLFKDKTVYICSDRDEGGLIGQRKVGRGLARVADVRIVELPYDLVPKHGKDLSDFWLEYDNADFEGLLAEAKPWKTNKSTKDPEIITVLDSFDAQNVGDPVKLQVTIKGKREPGYTIPHKVHLTCTRDAGPKCLTCPLHSTGDDRMEIPPTSAKILGMIGSPQNEIAEMLRIEYGTPKCSKLEIEIEEHQAVEQLFARPSIDHSDGTQARDYKNIKITSAGRHDTMANTTVVVTGALYPSPKDQRNEFLAWDVQQQETSVDRFELTPETAKLMKRFQARRGQTPLNKLGEINRELSTHVTRIVGRPEMHAVMDLTFHSPLSFKFGGQVVHRGWLESLIVGDTRTGKSEAAERLVRHFGAGEIVGGEAATLAGLVGGLQQLGGKDWAVTWGVIPINDRRLVVIDELSGLHPDEIAKMSDVRASGVARLTKIQQEVTFARTRLLWLGNPRNGGMDQFTYGVDALRPLIGNPEDIARFDLAMAVAKSDVSPDVINRPINSGELRYTSEACHTLLMWVWTRQLDQIVWARGAEDEVFKLALELGARYIEEPPLIQTANARIKICRVAIAIAARTFSTDKSFEKIIVAKEHVREAVKFIDMLYEMPSFGYAERSRERILDYKEAEENKEEIRKFLLTRRGLAKLLRSNSSFRRQDIEEVLNLEREAANAIINKLYSARMIRKQGGADNIVEPALHEIIKGVRW